MPSHLSISAFAKINLFLKIGKKNRSGYHTLHTLFQEISLHDRLKFTVTNGPIRLTCANPFVPIDESNLIIKALTMLKKKLKTKKGVRVQLIKRIPMGAGLGGGSTDAAAALVGGWRLWTGKKSIPPILFNLAKQLGADVSFFLKGGRCFASGIGDRLSSCQPAPRQWYVLITPPVHVSTKKAYSLWDRTKPSQHRTANSFESVIYKKFPEIDKVRAFLQRAQCLPVMLSGSGASVFGGVESEGKGRRILSQLRQNNWTHHLVHSR